jgi:membrane protein DedA with SNARE-associated domain
MNLAQSLIAFFSSFSGVGAYAAILGCLLVCGLGVPIPEDITLISAGILASMDRISLIGAMVAGFIGVLAGDVFLFFLGRKYGQKVFTWPGFRRIFTPERIEAARIRVHKDAKLICFIARFLPGLRSVLYLTSGTMGVKPSTFLVQDGLAALISVPVWVYVGYLFGENLDYLLTLAKKMNFYILIVLAVVIVGYVLYARRRAR